MFNHPDLMIAQAKMHQDELLAGAAHHRLLKSARQWRRAEASQRAKSKRLNH